MSKRSKIGQLARVLYCSPKQAKDFAAEVNRQISLYGYSPVSFDRIYHVLQMGNGRLLNATEVAHHFMGRKPARAIDTDQYPKQGIAVSPAITNGESRNETATPVEHFKEEAVANALAETQDNNLDSNLRDETLLWQILSSLTEQSPSRVTYAQIETALTGAGLDPFQFEDEYIWLIEQLESRNVLVVDQVADLSDSSLDEEAEAESNTKEVRQVLEEIYGKISEEEDRLLTAQEQRRLVEAVRNGKRAKKELNADLSSEGLFDALNEQVILGESALETLLVRNRRLVASLVLKHGTGARHLEFADLYQEGMLGLWRAIEGFDLDMDTRLSTYATYWIRQAISRAIADQDQTIRVPVHRFDTLKRLHFVTGELTSKLKRTPSEIEIAEGLNLLSPRLVAQVRGIIEIENGEVLSANVQNQIDEAVKQVKKLQQYANMQPISLDQPVGANDEGILGEVISDADADSVEEIVAQHLLQQEIVSLLESLTERQKYVIISRFGLGSSEEMTLEAIGKKFKVTRERIRQIESRTIDKLRRHPRAYKLQNFMEILQDEHSSDSMPPTQPDTEASA